MRALALLAKPPRWRHFVPAAPSGHIFGWWTYECAVHGSIRHRSTEALTVAAQHRACSPEAAVTN